eukprot:gnl/TRDRNA2_/TRDRNA2_128159_c0_seq2.p1 gnl/TRDRNA2_/TRDRNA2_128159_c0~~gnl/TRDRNA2_/TRDRNA2_128159_c0_seq2.p1  ORF type:complete len:657 (+),score=134.35 gnl/TRDRNA2_/TRDRNA2_128159_c0_seq2:54-2024(+)
MSDADPKTVIGYMQAGRVPAWFKECQEKQPKSTTHSMKTFKVFGTDEVLQFPLPVSTMVYDVKNLLAMKLGIWPGQLTLVHKSGSYYRIQLDHEECASKVTVKGIQSFSRLKHKWPNPITIIGTGHMGLRLAMYLIKHKESNFVVYDRKGSVGGTSWHDQANTTSKLQTELGTYHLQYDEDNPVPKNMKTWPTRDELLAHFDEVTREYGIMPYIKFHTDVKHIVVDQPQTPQDQKAEMAMTGLPWFSRTYRMTLKKSIGGESDETEFASSAYAYFPGNLSIPRKDEYKGEDIFEGEIYYGICNNYSYDTVKGSHVAIIGHGAFAVENVRTCCEYGAAKMYMIARRKNLACPRVVSWMINQSVQALSGPLTMRVMEPMYHLIGFDPWSYHSVFANEKRTHLTITQKARFGIGDVYFLAIALGMLEVVEDTTKRLSKHCVHLISGRKLEGVTVFLKLLGFVGNWDVDRLAGVKTMNGFWVNEDFRRFLVAEPIGVNANNFGGTSFSPGARAWAEQCAHFWWYPRDWGLVGEMLPKHEAEPPDRPAYVIDARHGTASGMMLGSSIMAFQESGAVTGPLKRAKQLECHPTRKYIDECTEEWLEYAKKWKEVNGAPNDIPLYPYTYENVEAFLEEEQLELKAMMDKMQAAADRADKSGIGA